MVDPNDRVKIDLGNKFRVIQDKLIELVLEKKLSIRGLGLFCTMVYFERAFSTELEIPFKDFAESIHVSPNNLRKQLKPLVKLGVLKKPKKDMYLINLDYGSRGKEVFRNAYDACGATIAIKNNNNPQKNNDGPQRNNADEIVDYEHGF